MSFDKPHLIVPRNNRPEPTPMEDRVYDSAFRNLVDEGLQKKPDPVAYAQRRRQDLLDEMSD